MKFTRVKVPASQRLRISSYLNRYILGTIFRIQDRSRTVTFSDHGFQVAQQSWIALYSTDLGLQIATYLLASSEYRFHQLLLFLFVSLFRPRISIEESIVIG